MRKEEEQGSAKKMVVSVDGSAEEAAVTVQENVGIQD